jgi:hypothetical protein
MAYTPGQYSSGGYKPGQYSGGYKPGQYSTPKEVPAKQEPTIGPPQSFSPIGSVKKGVSELLEAMSPHGMYGTMAEEGDKPLAPAPAWTAPVRLFSNLNVPGEKLSSDIGGYAASQSAEKGLPIPIAAALGTAGALGTDPMNYIPMGKAGQAQGPVVKGLDALRPSMAEALTVKTLNQAPELKFAFSPSGIKAAGQDIQEVVDLVAEAAKKSKAVAATAKAAAKAVPGKVKDFAGKVSAESGNPFQKILGALTKPEVPEVALKDLPGFGEPQIDLARVGALPESLEKDIMDRAAAIKAGEEASAYDEVGRAVSGVEGGKNISEPTGAELLDIPEGMKPVREIRRPSATAEDLAKEADALKLAEQGMDEPWMQAAEAGDISHMSEDEIAQAAADAERSLRKAVLIEEGGLTPIHDRLKELGGLDLKKTKDIKFRGEFGDANDIWGGNMSPDEMAMALREEGFDIQTPGDLAEALREEKLRLKNEEFRLSDGSAKLGKSRVKDIQEKARKLQKGAGEAAVKRGQAVKANVPMAPEPVPTAPIFGTEPLPSKLPKEISGSKPRYRDASPVFQSDIDKALFIVAQEKPSKSDAKFMKFLRDRFPDSTEAQLRAEGARVREAMKEHYKSAADGKFFVPKSEFAGGAKTERMVKTLDPETGVVVERATPEEGISETVAQEGSESLPPAIQASVDEGKAFVADASEQVKSLADPEKQAPTVSKAYEVDMADRITEAKKEAEAFAQVAQLPGIKNTVAGPIFGTVNRIFESGAEKAARVYDSLLATRDKFGRVLSGTVDSLRIRNKAGMYVRDKAAEMNVAAALDGQLGLDALAPKELAAYKTLKQWLDKIADIEGMSRQSRLSDYFPHLFDDTASGKARFAEFRKSGTIIDQSGAIITPTRFHNARTNQAGYSYDLLNVLNIRMNAGLKKAYMGTFQKWVDEQILKTPGLTDWTADYIRLWGQRLTGSPTGIEQGIDKFMASISTLPGMETYNKLAAGAAGKMGGAVPNLMVGPGSARRVQQAITKAYYRSLLGLALDTAAKNSFQTLNTIGEAGLGRTITGIGKTLKEGAGELIGKGESTFTKSGITKDYMSVMEQQADMLSSPALMKWWDNLLFKPQQLTEMFNRGVAYNAGRLHGMELGLTGANLDRYAKYVVEKTQFRYGVTNTSPYLNNPIGKLFYQFSTYPVNQIDFMRKLMRDRGGKGKMFRLLVAQGSVIGGGTVLGLDLSDPAGWGRIESGGKKSIPIPMAGNVMAVAGKVPFGETLGKRIGVKVPNQPSPAVALAGTSDYKASDALANLLSGAVGYPRRAITRTLGEDPFKTREVSGLLNELEQGRLRTSSGGAGPRMTASEAFAKYLGGQPDVYTEWLKNQPKGR